MRPSPCEMFLGWHLAVLAGNPRAERTACSNFSTPRGSLLGVGMAESRGRMSTAKRFAMLETAERAP